MPVRASLAGLPMISVRVAGPSSVVSLWAGRSSHVKGTQLARAGIVWAFYQDLGSQQSNVGITWNIGSRDRWVVCGSKCSTHQRASIKCNRCPTFGYISERVSSNFLLYRLADKIRWWEFVDVARVLVQTQSRGINGG